MIKKLLKDKLNQLEFKNLIFMKVDSETEDPYSNKGYVEF